MEQHHREQAHAHEMFERIERFLASGLSQTAFCRQEGLRHNLFRYWLKKYHLQEACPPPRSQHLRISFPPHYACRTRSAIFPV